MDLDRSSFRHLVFAMASVACGLRASEAAPVVVPAQPAAVPSAPPSAAVALPSSQPPAAEDADPASDPSCHNGVGATKACLRVSPTCEGLRDECEQLADDLRPRVAEKWAECFVKAKAPTCRSKTLGACMRRAAESACIEPGTVSACRSLREACRQAGTPATYSLETCAKVLSAVKPSSDPNGWERVDRERLGPGPTPGACTLEQVLPYQPWGPSWR